MTRAPLPFRDFAERLIAVDSQTALPFASNPPSVCGVIDQLRPPLVKVIGVMGFSAVLSKSLAIASTNVAWLQAVHVEADGSWSGLDDLDMNVGENEIFEGRVILLAEFVSLLVNLIGERLVLQFVQQALPAATPNDLFFLKGKGRE